MKPVEINVLCMDCGFQYVTGLLLWKSQGNKCPHCNSFKAQHLAESLNE